MTRARGSEEMESTEAPDLEGSSFKKLVLQWSGPDLVYTKVTHWISDLACSGPCSPTVGNFLQYCFTFAEDVEEHYELKLWMLNLVTHYVAEDESWLDNADDAKDWSRLSLISDWEVSPPVWAKKREEQEDKRLSEETEKTKESLECLTASPLDPGWGKALPAPTPTVAAPSTPAWRPWEEEKQVVSLSVGERRKRRSPAAAARSRRRLWQWQEERDRNQNRLKSESRITPQRSVKQMRGTRLLDRLESRSFEVEDHHLNGWGGSGEMLRVQCPILPLVDSFSDVVTASRSNLSMLHTTSLATTCWQKRAFCCGCGSWGNIIPVS